MKTIEYKDTIVGVDNTSREITITETVTEDRVKTVSIDRLERDITNIDTQITQLNTRKDELVAEILEVKTALEIIEVVEVVK